MRLAVFKSFLTDAYASVAAGLAPLRGRAGSQSAWLRFFVVGMIVLTATATIVAFRFNTVMQRNLSAVRIENRDVRIVQLALLDIESGARGFVLSKRMAYLQPYMAGLEVLEVYKPTLGTLDRFVAASTGSAPGTQTFSTLVMYLRAEVEKMIDVAQQDGEADLNTYKAQLDGTKATMDTLRHYLGQFLATKTHQADEFEGELTSLQQLLLVLQIVSGSAILAGLILAFRGMAKQSSERTIAATEAVRTREQVEHLFAMANILQSATGYEDANGVLRGTAMRLLPKFGGALYIFNNSRDRLDLSTTWGGSEMELGVAPIISPAQCWALKRGKTHLNLGTPGALRCAHAAPGQISLEIPMLARSELYGLLQIFSQDPAGADLEAVKPLAIALADSMSLALSSIALRERLRGQALRDPLTGLYNRRFMEEVLESFAVQAERRNAPISAIMIDLDHFKQLNDQHGHAAGDTILRDVAGVILAAIRNTDIACRYGGEELIVLLPDCDLDTAHAKAETIRIKIAELSRAGGVTISASLGIAAIPETSANAAELTAMADAALYRAKQSGRDRVVLAPLRRQVATRLAEIH